ncbi:hypothetical protein SAMN05421541_101153 [Actinoplanes philippinensis]|uniref:Uncharacterized protein n=1 Tax=Actinoplanes philippinensis TaxID=35752 RepID=A0A1I1ZP63_9ACTN|nr:hypothetical protein [Actinoplanes philippinensis]SFE32130.1 hypothetical protein SAMN05421541_101153 [Actinoplanes philippinensis]
MSGNGSPAHRAPRSVQRNRLIAVGAGLLLLLILLFALLAYCTGPDDPASTTAGPGPSTGASWTISPGPGSPGPGGAGDPEAAPLPGGSGTTTPADDVVTGDPATEPSDDDPERASTPEGGVDAGGGSQIDGRRLALLVTGGFLLLSAAGVGAYSLRRPLGHR